MIPVILCPVARGERTQYTKRLLPEFLMPHSVIRLDYLREAADLAKSERSDEAICELIGCVDARTARHQMRRLASAIEEVSLDLARRRAVTLELGDLPQVSPGTPPGQRLAILFDAEVRAGERAGQIHSLPSIRQLLQAAMGKRGRKKPSIRVSRGGLPP